MRGNLGCRISWLVLFFSTLSLLNGCGDGLGELVDQKRSFARSNLNILKQMLQTGQLGNAKLLNKYADVVKGDSPELSAIADQLRSEGTTKGQLFLNLEQRLKQVDRLDGQFGNPKELLPELDSIMEASTPSTFNNALADPLNVLADMSQGKLARVGVTSKSEEAKMNDVGNYGHGSQMIGNPAYGQWRNDRGTSFWEWYGMYSVFRDLTGGRRYYYDDWNRHRPYSYYQDVGVNRYGTSVERTKYASTYQKSPKRTYSGDRKSSSYASGSSGVQSRSRKPASFSASSSKTSGSSQRPSSSSKSYSGSMRSSSYSSRSSRGGK